MAQRAGNYTFNTNTQGNLEPMDAATTQLLGPGSWQRSSAVTPIGFDFWFMGVRYTQFSVNANGILRLGNVPLIPEGNSYTIPDNSRLVPFAATDAAQSGERIGSWRVSPTGKIHFKVTGTAPNRMLIVEFLNMSINYTSATADATFQTIIYETAPLSTQSGRFEFRYGAMRSTVNLNNTGTGFGSSDRQNDFMGIDLQSNPISARTPASSISNPAPIGNIAALHSTADGSRRVMLFTPPAPNGEIENLSASCSAQGSITLSWNNRASNAVGTVLFRSVNGGAFSFYRQINGASTFTDTGLNTGSNYQYRAYAVTEGRLSELGTSASLGISISEAQSLQLPRQIEACAGSIFTLDAGANFTSYRWTTPDGRIAGTGRVLNLTASQSGMLRLEVTDGNCRELRDSVQINVSEAQPPRIEGGGSFCPSEGFPLLSVPARFDSFRWTNQQGQLISTRHTAEARQPGRYRVEVRRGNCTFADSVEVRNCCEAFVEIPNAFTPHHSPANNLYRVGHRNLSRFRMTIHNRWGLLCFQTTDPDQGWDGTIHGKPAQADAYHVTIEYTGCEAGSPKSFKKTEVIYLID
jgi:gliding motility-associated-like protein